MATKKTSTTTKTKAKTKTKEVPYIDRLEKREKQLKKEIDSLPDMPDQSPIMQFNWKKWICATDWHMPFVNKKVFNDLINKAVKRDIRKLVVGGDFFNLCEHSHFIDRVPEPTWVTERAYARKVVNILQEQFTDIVFLASNHERRWMKKSGGVGSIADLFTTAGVDPKHPIILKDKVRVNDFMILHPDRARKQPCSYARERSNTYKDSHIVVAHAHMQARCMDPSGYFHLIDIGTMADHKQIGYKQNSENAFFEWQNGYMIVENGVPELQWFDRRKV